MGPGRNTLIVTMCRAATLVATLLLVHAAPAAATFRPDTPGPRATRHLLSGVLAGRITDRESGAPLPGARVTLVGSRFGGVADAAGRYRVVAPAGVYDVEVRLGGFHTRRISDVEIAEDETARLDIELGPAGGRDELARPDEPRMPAAPPPPAAALGGEGGRAEGGVRYHEEDAAPGRRRGGDWDRSGLLTAGDIDDHLNFPYFIRYVRRALREDRTQVLRDLGLEERVTLLVRDRNGRPASNARVRLTPEGREGRSLELVAGSDGRLHFYPDRDLRAGVRRVRVDVRPPAAGPSHTERIDLPRYGSRDAITIRIPARATLPPALDLALVLDVTGSMGDEHRYLTDEFESIVARVRRRYPQTDLRFALVVYRDHGDEFVVRSYGFTSSVAEMQRRLAAQRAAGGGDYPEAMDEALSAAVDLDWRLGNAARVLFLVADAPPHGNRFEATLRQVEAARRAGIRIYPVAASGVADAAEYLMRAAAVLTQGRHLFLTDDSGFGLPHQEPRVPCFVVTQLDQQIARVIESELAGRRVEPQGRDIIRRVGRYQDGVCGEQPVTYVPDGQW